MAALVTQVDLAGELEEIRPQKHHREIWCLVKFSRQPLGWVKSSRSRFGAVVRPDQLRELIADQIPVQVMDAMRTLRAENRAVACRPGISVVVCTRERPEELRRQLKSLAKLEYPDFEMIVVDNAPQSERTQMLCEQFPGVRYLIEPRKGLDYARNTGWSAATKEIVAYTDDDAVVDPYWLAALAENYADPQVQCVTGCTFPLELETEAQKYFEMYGGMQRGFSRKVYRPGTWNDFYPVGSGRFGAGVNLSLRKDALARLGGFDPALDCGSIARGGGDLDVMSRLIASGGSLVYEPRAIVWHQHRKTMAGLRQQMFDYGWGFVSHAIKQSRDLELGNHSMKMLRRWTAFWGWDRLRENLKLAMRLQTHFPIHLIVLEIAGGILGTLAYERSVRKAKSDALRHREPNWSGRAAA